MPAAVAVDEFTRKFLFLYEKGWHFFSFFFHCPPFFFHWIPQKNFARLILIESVWLQSSLRYTSWLNNSQKSITRSHNIAQELPHNVVQLRILLMWGPLLLVLLICSCVFLSIKTISKASLSLIYIHIQSNPLIAIFKCHDNSIVITDNCYNRVAWKKFK